MTEKRIMRNVLVRVSKIRSISKVIPVLKYLNNKKILKPSELSKQIILIEFLKKILFSETVPVIHHGLTLLLKFV